MGALIRESGYAERKKDFSYKMGIAQKEANETMYWLELLNATDHITNEQYGSINCDALEIMKLITAIIKTSKAKLNTARVAIPA